MGTSNFSRQFIKRYLEIVALFTRLTRKDVPFQIGIKEKAAFEELKKRFIEELVIVSFHEDRPNILQINALNICVKAIYLQPNGNGKLYPIVYYSETHSLAE